MLAKPYDDGKSASQKGSYKKGLTKFQLKAGFVILLFRQVGTTSTLVQVDTAKKYFVLVRDPG